MQIEIENKKGIIIAGSEQILMVSLEPDFNPGKEYEIAVDTYSKKGYSNKTDDNLVIKETGEYEISGIFINVARNNEESTFLDIIEIESENIRTLIYSGQGNINKDILNQFGVIDILVLNVNNFSDKKILTTVDPKILICYGNSENKSKYFDEVGIQPIIQDKLKVKDSDLAGEDWVLRLFDLK